MAKFAKNIERMIAELRDDKKVQVMHANNILKAARRRMRRRELCRIFLSAFRYRKNVNSVAIYDNVRHDVSAAPAHNSERFINDRKAKKAAIKQAIREKYDGSTLKARLMFLVEVVQGKYNEEFKELLDEACHEIDVEQGEIEGAKAAEEFEKRLEAKRTLSLNRVAAKKENKNLVIGNRGGRKVYQVASEVIVGKNGRMQQRRVLAEKKI